MAAKLFGDASISGILSTRSLIQLKLIILTEFNRVSQSMYILSAIKTERS